MMRVHLSRLLRLVSLVLLLTSVLAAAMSFGVRAAEPVSRCVLYNKWDGNDHYDLRQVDSRTGLTGATYRDYERVSTYQSDMLETAMAGQASMSIFRSNYSGPNLLLASVQGSEKSRLVAMEMDISGGWSPDGSTYAYIFDDNEHNYIAITDRVGKRRRVQPFGDMLFSYFVGWSADGKYIAAKTMTDALGITYYFISADTLQILPTMVGTFQEDNYPYDKGLMWSPVGHYFAYVVGHERARHLIIATPEQGIVHEFVLPADTWSFQWSLLWSADGRYVAVHSIATDNGLWYLSSSILGEDGSVHPEMKGVKINPNADDRRLPIESWWSADGTTWFFRQPMALRNLREADDNFPSAVMAYHVETRSYRLITEYVVGTPLLLNDDQWFAVPVWKVNTDTINVEVHSVDGNAQATIATGAMSSPEPQLQSLDSKQKVVAAVWYRMDAAGHRIAALSWAQADGSHPHTIDRSFDAITEIHGLDDGRSLLYIARRGAKFFVEIVDVETGDSVFRKDDLPLTAFSVLGNWHTDRVFPSPTGQQVALKVGDWEHQGLYLITLPTKQTHYLFADAISMSQVNWVEDGSMFAVMQYGVHGLNDTMHIISNEGSILQSVDMDQQYNSMISGGTLDAWSWCQ